LELKSKTRLEEEILSDIENIRKDWTLFQEKNFNARSEAIDYLEFHVIDRLDALMESQDIPDQMTFLKKYALKVRSHLEDVNRSIFHQFRSKISQDGCRGKLLMDLIDEYFDNNMSLFIHQDKTGYDNLDIFLNGILSCQNPPVESKNRELEMVYFQKTPIRIIFELIKRAAFQPNDVFFDLGSGLGQVVILVNLLTTVISKGVEFEPAFCIYAKACSAELHLKDVDFINTDARYADYSSGTLFFMYTPFEGKMLSDVIQNLQGESKKRRIKIFTYGQCSREVAKQNWLIKEYEMEYSSGKLCIFHSA
jgi:hypothetical protein